MTSGELDESAFNPKFGLGAQAIALFVASGIAQVLLAVLFIFVARNSSVAMFGVTAASIALGGVFVGVIDFGTNTLWIRELARGRFVFADLQKRLLSKLLVAVSVGLTLLAVATWLGFSEFAWPAFIVGIAFLVNQNSLIPLRAQGRADLVAICLILDRVSSSLFLLVMVSLGCIPSSALWISLSLGALVSTALSYAWTPRQYRLFPRGRSWRNPWKGSGFFGLTGLAISTQALDLPIAGIALGPSVAGIYGAVNRWIQPLSILISSFAGASAPFIAHAGDAHLAWKQVKGALWLPGLTLLGCLAVWIAAPGLVQILLGAEYQQSAEVLRVLIIGVVPSFGSQILLVAMQSLGKEKSVAVVLTISTVIQLTLVYFLSMSFGSVGVAIAFGIGQTITLVGLLFAIVRIRHVSVGGGEQYSA